MRKLEPATRAWIMYDWANSAFSTTVMAGFFPIFFKQYWSAGVDAGTSSLRLGTTNSIAALVVACLAPVLGAIADARSARRRFLFSFAGLGIAMTGALYFIGEGHWPAAAVVYALAILGFSGSMVFYDSLLVAAAPPEKRDYVSSLAFALGYLGGGVLFTANVAMTLWPGVFGLEDNSQAVRVSFLTVAIWWAVFSIPLVRKGREVAGAPAPGRVGLRQLADTFSHLRRHRTVFVFLLGYWLYIDGVHTIVRMATDYGLSLGFETNTLITALLVVQFVGFPASVAFGRLAERTGPKRAILVGIAVYIVIALWGARLAHAWEFYALAVGIGSVQGAVNALSRSFYSRLIPPERAAQFYGFYNTAGRFSAVIGPFLMGWVSYATGNPRLSMLAVIVLFVAGALIIRTVPESPAPEATP